jgi:hypothetical protein
MPREWRFIAPSGDSPTPSAERSPPPTLADVADAFVDRRPIDWGAARARVATEPQRAALEALRTVEQLRDGGPPQPRPLSSGHVHPAATGIAALAALQTAACLLVLLAAWTSGGAIANRLGRIAVALSFAASALVLRPAARVDGSTGYLLVAYTVAASTFARAATAGAPYAEWAMPLLRGLYPEAFIPACLWWFALSFPRVRRFAAFDQLGRRVAAAAVWVGVALFAVNLLGGHGLPLPSILTSLRRNSPANGFWTIFVLFAAPAVFAPFIRARRAAYAERRRTFRFAAALVLGAGPMFAAGVARAVVPAFDHWILAAPEPRLWLDLLLLAPLLATPMLTVVALQRDRPFGTIPFPTLPRRRLAGRSAALDSALLTTLDRIRAARSPRELSDVIAQGIRRGTGARHAAIMVPSAEGFNDPSGSVDLLDRHSALPSMLEQTPLVDVSAAGRIFPLLPAADRDWLTANAVDLMAAITHRDGALAAVVALGPRRRLAPYTAAERWLVTSIATAAAATWEATPARALDLESDDAALECARCGAVGPSLEALCRCGDPRAAALPYRLGGKFVVERRLGAGSMGVVYRARDTLLERDVAIKTLPHVSGAAVARLRHEARVMAALGGDGLATIYGVEIWRRTPALIVEYLPAGTLADRLRSAPLDQSDVVRLGIRLADALGEMHARGLLHRDIKPSNIGLTATGTPKLLDFGLALFRTMAAGESDLESDRRRASRRVAGTTAYLPPEALAGAPPGPSLDLWALAIVLREALTGSRTTPAPQVLMSLSSAWQPFFECALASRPDRRFADAAALRRALEVIQRELAG